MVVLLNVKKRGFTGKIYDLLPQEIRNCSIICFVNY